MFRCAAIVIAGCLLARVEIARGDGGALQAMQTVGAFQIAVFTSPNPLVAGPVDVSVLVQDAASLTPVPEAQVRLRFTPHGREYAAYELPATSALATNKLFRACHAELEPGPCEIEVQVSTGESTAAVRVPLQVGPRPTGASAFWPWYAWPAVPIVVFGMHAWLAGRRRV